MTARNFIKFLLLSVIAAFVAALLAGGSDPAHAANFTVNSVADTDDGTCDASSCTLREAINAANAAAGFDTILFDPTVFPAGSPATIAVTSALPGITDLAGTEVNGTGAGVIIDGTALVGAEHGLHFHRAAGQDVANSHVIEVNSAELPGRRRPRLRRRPGPVPGQRMSSTLVDGVVSLSNGGSGITRRRPTTSAARVVEDSTATDNGAYGINLNAVAGPQRAGLGDRLHGQRLRQHRASTSTPGDDLSRPRCPEATRCRAAAATG